MKLVNLSGDYWAMIDPVSHFFSKRTYGKRPSTSWTCSALMARGQTRYFFLLLILLTMPFQAAHAHLQKDLRFLRFTSKHGLSQNTVYAIYQDRRGFIWMGTRDGLNCFDGYEFKVWRHDPNDNTSLSSNFIMSIYEDAEGNIWLGTTGGINRFNPSEGMHFYRYENEEGDPSSLPNQYVQDVKPKEPGKFWVATMGGLILMDVSKDINHPRYQFYPLVKEGEIGLVGDQVWVTLPEDNGVWIGTNKGGLFYMDYSRPGNFVRYTHDPKDPKSLGGTMVRTILRDRTGSLWVGTNDGGLSRMDREVDGQFQTFSKDRGGLTSNWISALYEDTEGRLWIGSYNSGVYLKDGPYDEFFHYQHQPLDPNSLSYDAVWSFYQDRSESLWIGTYGGGVNRVNPAGSAFKSYFHMPGIPSISHSSVRAIELDKNDFWAATDDGLSRIIRKQRHGRPSFVSYTHDPKNPHSLPHDGLTDMVRDDRGTLWLGSREAGLIKMALSKPGYFENYLNDPEDDSSLAHNKIACLFAEEGTLWVGTDLGLHRMTLDKPGVFQRYQAEAGEQAIAHNWIMEVVRDKKGRLWIGTYGGGLNRMIDEEKGHFTALRHHKNDPTSLSHDGIRTIFVDRDNTVWVGTAGGLNRLNPDLKTFRSYRVSDGLPNDVIYAIQQDDSGALWVSSNRGLSRMNIVTETFTNFDTGDGLPGNEFLTNATAIAPDGEVFFGSIEGLTSFYPSKIQLNSKPPALSLTGIYIDNQKVGLNSDWMTYPLDKPIEVVDKIRLHYNERSVSFSFAALHFAEPEKNRYRYRLEPFNQDWVYTHAGNRRATYTNLSGGTYLLRVQGSNKDGVWSDKEINLVVKVDTPPWKTWWVRSLAVLLLLAMFLYYRHTQGLKLERERLKVEHLKHVERLKDEFNQQLEKKVVARTRDLASTRRKLLETARLAGMAEIASDVLHSVGNSLNSVKTTVHLVQEKAGKTQWLDLLERIASQVDSHKDDLATWFMEDTRTRELPRALNMIAANLKRQQTDIKVEGEKLFHLVQNIVSVLWEQQKYTREKGWSLETYDLNLLIGDTLLSEYYLFRDRNIIIDEELTPLQPIKVDRGKVNRMLFFLLKNAVEAIKEGGKVPGHIRIATCQRSNSVLLEVHDDGIGMEDRILKRVFEQGFSTKEKCEGFGLHYCANAMKEMNGSIEVKSNGKGKGSCVTLVFPLVTLEESLDLQMES